MAPMPHRPAGMIPPMGEEMLLDVDKFWPFCATQERLQTQLSVHQILMASIFGLFHFVP